jgi:Na+/proline symporter
MNFPRLTPKQRLADAAMIAFGVGALLFSFSPRDYGYWQLSAGILGLGSVACGIIDFVAKRHRVPLVGLTLLSALAACISESVWGLAIGASLVPLATAVFAATRKRSD